MVRSPRSAAPRIRFLFVDHGSFHASFSVRLTTNALRFPSVPATRFREDFHLQVIAHAGPTTRKRAAPITRDGPQVSISESELVEQDCSFVVSTGEL